MAYLQITPEERYTLATLRKQVPALSNAHIARLMGRHRSTITREIARNSTPYDRAYRPFRAQEQANGRRSRSRRNSRFTAADWKLVVKLMREGLSPDQVSGRLQLESRLEISYESIYRYIRRDKKREGSSSACFAYLPSGANALPDRSAAAGSPASVTFPSDHRPSRPARNSDTGKWTPSSVRPTAIVPSPSSNEPQAAC